MIVFGSALRQMLASHWTCPLATNTVETSSDSSFTAIVMSGFFREMLQMHAHVAGNQLCSPQLPIYAGINRLNILIREKGLQKKIESRKTNRNSTADLPEMFPCPHLPPVSSHGAVSILASESASGASASSRFREASSKSRRSWHRWPWLPSTTMGMGSIPATFTYII